MLNRFKIGHYSNLEAATGTTVILPPEGNISSAMAMGASPGSREFALLAPDKKIESIHALTLTGGSAYGLQAASGVMHALERQKIGYQTPWAIVPIVPAAVIYDLNVGSSTIRPDFDAGVKAVENAHYNNFACGTVGAGTGATVGKWAGLETAMKGGLGLGHAHYKNVKVSAVLVVNAVGDIVDENGKIIAGAYNKSQFLGLQNPTERWISQGVETDSNTVLCAILTNAQMSKAQAFYQAQRAHLAMTKHIEPSHTSFDGDIAFTISSNEVEASLDIVSNLIFSAVGQAIMQAVNSAEPIAGVLSAAQLKR